MEQNYINLIPERNTPVFHASQDDNNIVIRCDLYDGVKTYTLSGTEISGLGIESLTAAYLQ